MPSDVEDEVVSRVGFYYGDDPEDDSSYPEYFVAKLVSAGEVLVEHMHYCEENHRIGRVVVYVPNDVPVAHIIVYGGDTVERDIAGGRDALGAVAECREVVEHQEGSRHSENDENYCCEHSKETEGANESRRKYQLEAEKNCSLKSNPYVLE